MNAGEQPPGGPDHDREMSLVEHLTELRARLLRATFAVLAGGEGFTVVLSSHDIEEVDRLADHVVMLNHGAVLLDENTDALLARHRRVEILLPPDFGALPHFPASWIAAQSAGRVLRFTDTAGLSQIDVPVTATVADSSGLWVGQAAITEPLSAPCLYTAWYP